MASGGVFDAPADTPPDATPDGAPAQPDTAPDTQPTTTEDVTESSEAPEEPSRAFVEWWDSKFEAQESAKYKSDSDFIESLRNAKGLIGQRNDDAVIGKLYRDHASEFQEYLTGRGRQPEPAAAPPPDAGKPLPYHDYRHWSSLRDPNTGRLPSHAPPGMEARLSEMDALVAESAYNQAVNPAAMLQPVLEQYGQHILTEAQRSALEQAQSAQQLHEAESWGGQNANWLFINGDRNQGRTAAGQKFYDQFVRLENYGGSVGERCDAAMQLARITQPVKAPKVPTPQATRKPASAAPPARDPTSDEVIDQMFDSDDPNAFFKVCAHLEKERAAAANALG